MILQTITIPNFDLRMNPAVPQLAEHLHKVACITFESIPPVINQDPIFVNQAKEKAPLYKVERGHPKNRFLFTSKTRFDLHNRYS